MTAKMAYSHQFYNGKTNMFNGDAEVTPDLHFRMSKKIAQLTKVIYSLKTKTDEHDSTVENLKSEHNDKVQALLQDTKVKLEAYQVKIRGELQMQKQIEALENNLLEFEQEKQKALNEFNNFRLRAENRETVLKSEHSEKLLNMSQDVLVVKREFETQIKRFGEALKDSEFDQIKACEDLDARHRLELERLQESYNHKLVDVDGQISSLKDEHLQEQQHLKEQFRAERLEFEKTIEDYELKLNKAQAFYDKELEALKSSYTTQVSSDVESVKKGHDNLKKQFNNERKTLNERIDRLLSQIVTVEQESKNYRVQIDSLNATIVTQEDNALSLDKQLAELRNKYNEVKERLHGVETELGRSQHTCEEQTEQLSTKSKMIIKSQAKERELLATITSLQNELKELQSQFGLLEAENKKLFGSNVSTQEKTSWEVQELKKTLENLKKEKKKNEDKLKRELTELDKTSTKKQTEMHNEFTSSVVTLEKQYKGQIEMLETTSAQELDMLRTDLEQKMKDQSRDYERDYRTLDDEFTRFKKETLAKLDKTEAEVLRLNSTVQNSEQGLGSAASQISSLTSLNEKIQIQLNEVTTQLNATKLRDAAKQNEIEKLTALRNSDRHKTDLLLKSKLQQLTVELDSKWMKQLAEDNARLHEELTTVKDSERQNALYEQRITKELELRDVQEEANKRINDLLQQMANAEIRKQQEIEALRKEWINKGVSDTALEYNNKMTALEEQYKEKIERLTSDYANQLAELEKRLKQQHLTELQTQMIAHRAVVEGAKADVDRQRMQDIAKLKTSHFAQMNSAREALLEQHNSEMERNHRQYEYSLNEVKGQLQTNLDISKNKERETATCIEDLRTEIAHRDHRLRDLTSNVDTLRKQHGELSSELSSRSQQIDAVRNEATSQLQRRIDQCEESKVAELAKLNEDHKHHIQKMLGEFGNVQVMFKERIVQLNAQLMDSEARYTSRESKPEDLEMMDQLRDTIADRDADIKHLKQEKKYYELELVNRETNFNKIFTGQPAQTGKVAILHTAPPKKKASVSEKALAVTSVNSARSSNSSSRLDPLPGSPFHDEKLNRIKPLPPPGVGMNKKYVRS